MIYVHQFRMFTNNAIIHSGRIDILYEVIPSMPLPYNISLIRTYGL